MVPYRELITAISDRIAVTTQQARQAAEATVATLAQTLDAPQRQQLLAEVPTQLHEQLDPAGGPAPDAASFVTAVSWLTGLPAEQARYRAQAVLAVLSEYDPALIDSLELPNEIKDLTSGPPVGGGITGPAGRTAPLTAAEVHAALADLPGWRGDTHAISRTITLPPPDLNQVLDRVESLRQQTGRAPIIHRDGDTADITVRTNAVNAVTRLDLDLAHRADAIIAEGPPELGSGPDVVG